MNRRNLKLPDNFVDKKEVDKWETIRIPVVARQIAIHSRKTAPLDIFAKTTLNFFRLGTPPGEAEIARRMDMPLSAIRRIVRYLQKNDYLSASGKFLKSGFGEQQIKKEWVFYEELSGCWLHGVLSAGKLESEEEGKGLVLKRDSPCLPEKLDRESLEEWLRLREDECDLLSFSMKEEGKTEKEEDETQEFLLPVKLYFGRGEVRWKVQDPFNRDKFSLELKELIRRWQRDLPAETAKKIDDKLDELCEEKSSDDERRKETEEAEKAVITRWSKAIRNKPYCDKLILLEKIRTEESENPEYSAKNKKRVYSLLNTALEYLLPEEIEKRGGDSSSKRQKLTDWGEAFLALLSEEEKKERFEEKTFKEWVERIAERRKQADHSDRQNFPKAEIEEDLQKFDDYFAPDSAEEQQEVERQTDNRYKKMRSIIEKKSREWPFLPEEIIGDFAFAEVNPNDPILKAVFWEAVFRWFIRKNRLANGDSVEEWRKRVREALGKFKEDEEIIKELVKPKKDFVEKAVAGKAASLEAYAVVIFLSDQPQGDETLQSILGETWWRDLITVRNNRDNHKKNRQEESHV